jgi:hypothetical protein
MLVKERNIEVDERGEQDDGERSDHSCSGLVETQIVIPSGKLNKFDVRIDLRFGNNY